MASKESPTTAVTDAASLLTDDYRYVMHLFEDFQRFHDAKAIGYYAIKQELRDEVKAGLLITQCDYRKNDGEAGEQGSPAR